MSTHTFARSARGGTVKGFTRSHGGTESLVLMSDGGEARRREAQSNNRATQREGVEIYGRLCASVSPCETYPAGHMRNVGGQP
jgi:hypothetical protein